MLTRRAVAVAAAVAALCLAWPAASAPAALAATATPAGGSFRERPAQVTRRAAPGQAHGAAPGRGAATRLARDLQAAWQITRGGGVTVALVGLPVDPATPGLAGKVITGPHFGGPAPGGNIVDSLTAAAIAGSGPDAQTPYGNVGMAPGARVLSLQVPNAQDGIWQQDVGSAIRYAVRHYAQVILVDEAGSDSAPALDGAVQFAQSENVVVVAVGYRPRGLPASAQQYPDALPGVLTARAVTVPGTPQTCGTYRAPPAGTALVAAPANNLPFAAANGGIYALCDANAAAAWLTSTVVMIKALFPRLSPGLVARAIAVSARDRPARGYSAAMASGMLNPAGALHAAAALQHLPAVAAPGPGSVDPAQRLTAAPAPGPIRAVRHSPLLLAGYSAAMLAGAVFLGLAGVAARRRRVRAG